MINYTERITLLIDDVVKRVPALRYIDPTQPAGVREVRALARGRRLRDLPLPDLAVERTGLLLLARPPLRDDHPAVRVVHHQVADRPHRGEADRLPRSPSACRVSAIRRSPDRASTRSIPTRNPGWRSSTRSSTSSITSIRRSAGSAASCVADGSVSPYAHSPEFFARGGGDGTRLSRDGAGPGRLRLPPRRLRRTHREIRRHRRHDIQGLPVVSAALHGGGQRSAGAARPGGPRRTAQAAVAADALHSDDLYVRQFLADTSRRLVRTGEHRAA